MEQDVAAQLTYFKEKVFANYQLPDPIYIRAVRKGTNQSVLLNGQYVFPVVASEVEKPVQITLGERKLNLICFHPANIYLLKVNNRNTRKRCEISSLTIKASKRRH